MHTDRPALTAAVITLLAAVGALAQAPADDRPYPLMIGDPAPPLTVKEWIKGEPVTLGNGRVTLLEFWATWCGPCREGMPHLTELQRKYKDKVTIIGVNAWEPDQAEVRPFVEKNAARMGYTVVTDDVAEPPPEKAAEAKNHSRWATQNGKMSLGWMKASGWMENGIPCAFIVDQQGRLAWAGNPANPLTSIGMDEALEKIVAGTWDLSAAAAEYQRELTTEVKARALWKQLGDARRARDWPVAVAVCEKGLALGPRHADFAGPTFRIVLYDLKDRPRALAFGREMVQGAARDNWIPLGDIASHIVNPPEGAAAPDHELAALARDAAQRADQVCDGTRPYVIDSLARAHFLLGDARAAVREQERALLLAHSDQMRKHFQSRLDEYRAAAEGR